MEHSKNYGKVKRYYNLGMWNEVRVRNAVKRTGLRKKNSKRSQTRIMHECSCE